MSAPLKVIDYEVVYGRNTGDLRESVAKRLRDGWQPHGSMSHTSKAFLQPMVKYEEKPT